MNCCFRTLLLLPAFTAFATALASASVSVERVPDAGLQPHAVSVGSATHLVYLTGDPKAADIVYRTRAGTGDWSAPVRVNSQPGSAIAIGTIRGPQMAIGRSGRVHVAWNGSENDPGKGAPMLYARLDDTGRRFSPQRNVMAGSHELDGGGSVAADDNGRVQVVWHASPAGSEGETNRAVFVAQSTDDGNTFASERVISPPGTGACGCCALTAFANARGEAFVLYRSARTALQRDMKLLVSSNGGGLFRESLTDPWLVGACPMSSANLTGADDGAWAAWETAGRIQLARLSERDWTAKPRAVGPLQGAKHPRIAINDRGEVLVVWTEGTGWQKGGSLAWQVFDANGQPASEKGQRDGLPAWSFATAHARADGSFVVLY